MSLFRFGHKKSHRPPFLISLAPIDADWREESIAYVKIGRCYAVDWRPVRILPLLKARPPAGPAARREFSRQVVHQRSNIVDRIKNFELSQESEYCTKLFVDCTHSGSLLQCPFSILRVTLGDIYTTGMSSPLRSHIEGTFTLLGRVELRWVPQAFARDWRVSEW